MAFTLKYPFILQTILALQIGSVFTEPLGMPAATEFSRFSVFKPHLYHGRNKRQISSTRDDQNQDNLEHIHDIIIDMDLKGKSQQLNLRLNRELIPKGYFEKHQQDGSHVVRRPGEKDVELCHYQGKLRGVDDSWAALSTCNGLSGVVFDGKELYHIEKATNSSNIHDTNHFLYSHSDLVTNFTCGSVGSAGHVDELYETISKGKRFKRSDEVIVPYNANDSSRYVELLLVVNRGTYKKLGSNMKDVSNYCKNLVNIINSLYTSLNIFIALVGLVVWTEKDEIDMSTTDSAKVLDNFSQYTIDKLNKDHPHDNAHLLINQKMDNMGLAYLGAMCLPKKSVGLTSLYEWHNSRGMVTVAIVAAHEIAHGLGIDHDWERSNCRCDKQPCIMNDASYKGKLPASWSSCNKQDLEQFLMEGKDHCLRNKPTKLYDSPVCGNEFLEAGEECDCGLVEYCNERCCNPYNCLLYRTGVCATETTTEISKKQKGKGFTVITHTKKNWYEAFADCRKRGLDLATIYNEREYMELYSKIKHIAYGSFWLSATDLAKKGTFVWMSTGEDVRYHKWHRTGNVIQPDNYVQNGEVEHCMELSYNIDYMMNDGICRVPSYYVCDDQNLKKPKKSERSNKTFTVITGNKLSWYEALIDCERRGLRLATVESQKEQEEVIKSIKRQGLPNSESAYFWLSGSDLGRTNNYVWMTSGQPLNYTAWYSVEPNHLILSGETEHCLNVRNYYGYTWNDAICSRKHYYICDNQA